MTKSMASVHVIATLFLVLAAIAVSKPSSPYIYSSPPPPYIYSSPPPPPPFYYSSPPPPSSVPALSPPPTPTPQTSGKKAKCKNKNYLGCYKSEHTCPISCPDSCEVDCATCSPVCYCNQPGAICLDPRFVGADGLTFYFHGEKNKDFL